MLTVLYIMLTALYIICRDILHNILGYFTFGNLIQKNILFLKLPLNFRHNLFCTKTYPNFQTFILVKFSQLYTFLDFMKNLGLV